MLNNPLPTPERCYIAAATCDRVEFAARFHYSGTGRARLRRELDLLDRLYYRGSRGERLLQVHGAFMEADEAGAAMREAASQLRGRVARRVDGARAFLSDP